jgi:thymidylate synthase (FAD)
MKLIESKAEYIPQEEGLEGIYKIIEVAGRTAYHSQDKITPTSAKDFVDRMIKSKHGTALEAGTVYLDIPEKDDTVLIFGMNPYSETIKGGDSIYHITTNYRVLIEHDALWTIQKYGCNPSSLHEKRYTMRFTCSRAIANELVRHRTMSFLQESTRYINYSKERHGGEITFIIPSRFGWQEQTIIKGDFEKSGSGSFDSGAWINSLLESESTYKYLLKEGWTPQQARDVLPNATKTELIMTGFSSDWRHVMDLRLFGKTGAPHPDMIDLMQKAQKSMQEAGIWEDIMSKPSKFE